MRVGYSFQSGRKEYCHSDLPGGVAEEIGPNPRHAHFNLEVGGSMLFWNTDNILQDYTVSQPTKPIF
jgi:hypothetical protein